MPKPTEAEVLKAVTQIVSGFTGMSPAQIQPALILRDPPLSFDDIKLGFLAISLRGYVKSVKPAATFLAADTRKKGQTVEGLAKTARGRM